LIYFRRLVKKILQNFLADELTNSKLNESRIDFKDFLNLFKKWYLPCVKDTLNLNEGNDDILDSDRFGRPDSLPALKTSRSTGNQRDLDQYMYKPNGSNNNTQSNADDETSKTEDITVDHSISTIHGNDIDYIEDLSI